MTRDEQIAEYQKRIQNCKHAYGEALEELDRAERKARDAQSRLYVLQDQYIGFLETRVLAE